MLTDLVMAGLYLFFIFTVAAVVVLLGVKRIVYILIAFAFFGLCVVWLLFYYGFWM